MKYNKLQKNEWYKLNDSIFKLSDWTLLNDANGYALEISDWIGKPFPSSYRFIKKDIDNVIISINELKKMEECHSLYLEDLELEKIVETAFKIAGTEDAFALLIKRNPQREREWILLSKLIKKLKEEK